MHRRLYKVRKHLGLTQKQIADILGIGQNAYSMIENGRISLTDRNRTILAEKLYVNPLYLTQERGEMLLDTDQFSPVSQPMQDHRGQEIETGVPYYSKPVTGSMVISFDDMSRDDPEYYINMAPFNDCAFYRPVFGESMSPRYNPGDIVACKRVHNKNLILYGETYLCMIALDGDFYETIKILRRNLVDPSLVILKPCNETFDETIVPIDAISELYIIKGKIERTV